MTAATRSRVTRCARSGGSHGCASRRGSSARSSGTATTSGGGRRSAAVNIASTTSASTAAVLAERPPALELKGLTKRYDDGTEALVDFDLVVPDGAFFGLLGPNGAGKTTLISAVCNLIRITA